jgi:hypothetical protein
VSSDREFPIFLRGEVRDEILGHFRNGLRQMVNPDTGLAFTEEEIAFATSSVTRWFKEADAIDLLMMAAQSRALWLSDQIWPDRASTEMLRDRHGKMRGLQPLPATGGSGTATGACLIGATFIGSTTVPDPDDVAHYARDPQGRRYQVLYTKVATATSIKVSFKGIDTGRETNITAGTKLSFLKGRGPLGSDEFVVDEQFKDGAPAESDADFAARILAAIRYKQGCGNRAQQRMWARSVDVGILDAFVYPCAYHAGSGHICVLSKRNGAVGPLARIASVGTVASVVAFVTPPGSPTVPGHPYTIATTAVSKPTDILAKVDLPKGAKTGWTDAQPWPSYHASGATIVSAAALSIEVSYAGGAPPIARPALMVWDETTSRWAKLSVASWIDLGGGTYVVTLASLPEGTTLAAGQYLSPDTERREIIAQVFEAYFDSLGPGELVPATDDRFARAHRFPLPSAEWPYKPGDGIATWLEDVLGPSLGQQGATLDSVTPPSPLPPTNPKLGPELATLGKLSIFPKD